MASTLSLVRRNHLQCTDNVDCITAVHLFSKAGYYIKVGKSGFFPISDSQKSSRVLYQWATKRGMQQNVVGPVSKSNTFHAGFHSLD